MAKEIITVKVLAKVVGPNGERLRAGMFAHLEDSKYVRALIKGGTAELVDPPSLDYIDNPSAIPGLVKNASNQSAGSLPPEAADAKPHLAQEEAPKAEETKFLTRKPKAAETKVEESTASEAEDAASQEQA